MYLPARPHSRGIWVMESDTHGGFKLALMRPGITLQDENDEPWQPQATQSQIKIYEARQKQIEDVKDLARGDPIIYVHGGDITHGNHFKDKEVVSVSAYHMLDIAEDNMMPWAEIPNVVAMRFIRGTGVHEFMHGSSSMEVAKRLSNKFPDKDIKSVYHSSITYQDRVFDLSHHGPSPGNRTWLRGNILRLYTQSLMDNYLADGDVPPYIMVRSHYHEPTWETVHRWAKDQWFTTEAIITPSQSLLDDHARKATRSKGTAYTGLVALEIVDGVLVGVYPFVEKFNLKSEEVIADDR